MSSSVQQAKPSIGSFLRTTRWIDGRPLQIEPYRMRLFELACSRDPLSGALRYSLVLSGRAKKNYKTLDAALFATYCLFDESPQGSQVYLVANDEAQAGDDLDLTKKLFRANPHLDTLVTIRKNRIERQDGGGFIEVLPARDALGLHGKTYRALICDEIHGWRDWDVLEALAPDPTRADAAVDYQLREPAPPRRCPAA